MSQEQRPADTNSQAIEEKNKRIEEQTTRLKRAEHLLNRWLALFELGGGPPERDSATVRETREFLGQ